MLDGDLVKRADDGSLEQAPHVLDAVGVDESADPFLGAVVDGLVPGILVPNADVGGPLIGIDRFGLVRNVLPNPALQDPLGAGVDNLQANLAVALHRTNDGGFVGVVPVSLPAAPLPAANPGLVNLDDAREFGGLDVAHRLTNAVAEEPRGFVGRGE